MFSLFVIFAGVIALKNMNAETNPAVDFATAIVSTPYIGASAKDIEVKITKPIEDEIRKVRDIKDVRSISQPGLSTIVIRVDMDKRGVDIPYSMAELQRAVDRVSDLPVDLVDLPKFTEIKSEEFLVFTIVVTGSNENRFRDIVADLLKDEIQDNKNVKAVSLDGYNERRFHIELDLAKMNYHHIGINEVTSKIGARNVDFPSGEIKTNKSQLLTRIEAKVQDVKDLEELIVRANFSGKSIKLKDISTIIDGEEEARFLSRYNGKEATILTISKKSKADTLELVADIKKKVTYFQEQYKDKLSFHLAHDESKEVKKRLSVLSGNAVIGLVIILILLFAFLPWKIGFAAALSLPLSIFSTLAAMYFLGIDLNTVTILALVIVLGMLVDDSVIISENFTKYRHRGISPLESSLMSIKIFWLPITATVLTTMAAFLPMLITQGIMGAFIKWIPIIVCLALLLSLFECFFFLPMRLTYLGGDIKKDTKEEIKKDWFHKFELKFENFVAKLIRIRYLVLIVFTGIVFFSFYLVFVANKFILFPAEQTLIYITKFDVKGGSRIENTSKVAQELSFKIKDVLQDGAEHIVARAGLTDLDASQPNYKEGSNVGYIWTYVDDYTQNNLSYNEVLAKLRTIKSDKVNNLTFEALVNGPPVGYAIEATFRSNSFDDIDRLIAKIKPELAKVEGVSDLIVDDVIVGEEVFINIDYDKADKLGLDVDTIGSAVRAAVGGVIVSNVTIDNKEIDLFVRFKEKFRTSIKDLRNIMIMDKSQNLVPLGNFVSFTKSSAQPYIKRYDYRRSKSLLGNVDDDIISPSEANNILRKIYAKYQDDFPSVSMKFGGVEESTGESLESLGRAFNFAIAGIFILLVFLFRSYMKPFIILTTIPLGLLGFGIAFLLHQKPVSFLALIGIIGLAGVIVNSGIVLISYILRLKEEDAKFDLHKILAYASSMRLRSVVITSLTTIAGFVPTAYGIGGKDEILSPMTLAMLWGLTSGTILTIMWVPCAYAILDDASKFFTKILKLKK